MRNHLEQLAQQMGSIEHLYDRWLQKQGIPYNRFAVLYGIAVSEEQRLTQKNISEAWQLSKQTVFSLCKQLQEQGLIAIQDSEKDRREKWLVLTEKGQAQADGLVQAFEQLSQTVFEQFGAENTRQLSQLLQQFEQVFAQHVEQASCGKA